MPVVRHTLWSSIVGGLLVVCLGITSASTVAAADVVVVVLQNGRVLAGSVGEQTDDSDLWLFSAELSILVSSATPWSDVASATVRGKTLTAAQFQAVIEQLKTPVPPETFQHPAFPVFGPPCISRPRVQSLEILASLRNWDRDLEPDGLEVRLDPLTCDDDLAIVDGLATVRLLGRRRGLQERLETTQQFGFWTDGGSVSEYAPRRGYQRYVELGRWTERIRAVQWTERGYVVRLPFRRVHPEHDLDIALDGVVDVRLNVTGQGTWNATTPVQLRTFSPLREDLELYRRTRYFPDER